MKPIRYYSTNDKLETVNFETALMNGLASQYGLYMIEKGSIPGLTPDTIWAMRTMSYARIAFEVLFPFLRDEIKPEVLMALLEDAYDEDVIPTRLQPVTGKTHIMWLTGGPTYSFKDYAARFFGRILNHYLKQSGRRKVVVVATSGDTGGAVADALSGLNQVDNIVFFPKGSITERQRRQMTTLQGNVYAFEVNGDFDVCQALAKRLLGEKEFAGRILGDREGFTSANSISIGRLLPQIVYPFFAYSRVAEKMGSPLIASIPSGNFGDMMGTVMAREMGLPIGKIICGVNENQEFPEFLRTEDYVVKPSVISPSSAMIVSNPSNFARLVDLYGGHVSDQRGTDGKVVREGVMDRAPDIAAMRNDFYSVSIGNDDHYHAMHAVYQRFGIVIEPHGAVGWQALDMFFAGEHDRLAVIYETADPGKFPDDVHRAIGVTPDVPPGIARQARESERIYSIDEPADRADSGMITLSDAQYRKAKEIIEQIFT